MNRLLLLILLCFFPLIVEGSDTIRVVSYNVENLFDCTHDTLKNDYDYLPEGKCHYTLGKYRRKIGNISRVLSSIGGLEPPVLVGLCEVENEKILLRLTRYSLLKNLHYSYVHQESPDERGVDVALLYQSKKFHLINKRFLSVCFPSDKRDRTRDILYVCGTLKKEDTLHIYLLHAPSRLGGELVSEPKRMFVTSIVRHDVDSILNINPLSNIIVMGDFNDYPSNKSIYEVLKATEPTTGTVHDGSLYNLMAYYDRTGKMGTNKFHGQWGVLDQLIVSGHLLEAESAIHVDKSIGYIYHPDFLLQQDKTYLGCKPFRTYSGYRYLGGYSDHLPVYLDLICK